MNNKIVIVILVFVILSSILSACFPTPTPVPTPTLNTSAEFIEAAWKSYNNKEYSDAISLAQECINRWENDALEQQATLKQEPPMGKVSEEEKKAIYSNWALNDVGAAYLIIGLSLQEQGKSDEAREAYEKTNMFPYARTWDPQGFFWSPSEEAGNRLAKMP